MRIFVISLRRSVARRQALTRDLMALGLHYELVDAVDGAALTEAQRAWCDLEAAESQLGRPMTPGEVGCALSHLEVYRRMLEGSIERAVVLEDDAIVDPDFPAVLEALAGTREELVLLYHAFSHTYFWAPLWSRLRRPLAAGRCLVPFSVTPASTVAYYLTLHAARVLQQAGLPVRGVADWPLSIGRVLGAKGVFPALVQPDDAFRSETGERLYRPRSSLRRYLSALTFLPYIRERADYPTLGRYLVERLLSVPLYDRPAYSSRPLTSGGPPIPEAAHARLQASGEGQGFADASAALDDVRPGPPFVVPRTSRHQ
jgi:glycosyl transferase, family 25